VTYARPYVTARLIIDDTFHATPPRYWRRDREAAIAPAIRAALAEQPPDFTA
jgi:hypothetical protein